VHRGNRLPVVFRTEPGFRRLRSTFHRLWIWGVTIQTAPDRDLFPLMPTTTHPAASSFGSRRFCVRPARKNTSIKTFPEKFRPYNTSMAILIYSNTAAKNRGGCVVFFYGHRNVKDCF